MKVLKIIFVVLLFPSCVSYQAVNKRDKTVTKEMIANLKAGKRYEFELKTGNTLTITIEKLDAEQLIGFHHTHDSLGRMVTNPFSDSFENLEKNTAKISVSKFNPFLTSMALLTVPAAIIGLFFLIHDIVVKTF